MFLNIAITREVFKARDPPPPPVPCMELPRSLCPFRKSEGELKGGERERKEAKEERELSNSSASRAS